MSDTCSKCGGDRVQPEWLSADGYKYCIECYRAAKREWRRRRKESGNPVISTKMPRDWHREYEREYFRDENNRRRRNKTARDRNKDPKNQEKLKARWLLNRAVCSGRIIPGKCEVCGSEPTEGHHEDYTKPLDVKWLCRTHHAELHAKATGEQPRNTHEGERIMVTSTTTTNFPERADLIEQYRHKTSHKVSFANNCSGPDAVAFAVKQLLEGKAKIARFVVMNHPNIPPIKPPQQEQIHLGIGIGEVDGRRCFRWLGSELDPNGPGSHSVIATWYDDCMDETKVALSVLYNLVCYSRQFETPTIFRNLDDFDLHNGHN